MPILRLLAVLATLFSGALVLAFPSFAVEDAPDRQTRLHVIADDDRADLELPELEVGESRTFHTDGGDPVEVERTEEGLRITVAGKEVMVAKEALGGHGHTYVTGDGADGSAKRVVVLADAGADVSAEAVAVVLDGEGEEEARVIKRVETGEDGEQKVTVKVLTVDETGEEGEEVIVLRGGSGEGEDGPQVIEKRIVVGEDGEEKEVRVRVLTGDDAEGYSFASDGDSEVVVLSGDKADDGKPVVVKVRVKKETKDDTEN